MCAERRGDLVENQDELFDPRCLDLVERLALDVLHQQLDASDPEPGLLDPHVVDLDDRLDGSVSGKPRTHASPARCRRRRRHPAVSTTLRAYRLPPAVLSLISRMVLPAPLPSTFTTRYVISLSLGRLDHVRHSLPRSVAAKPPHATAGRGRTRWQLLGSIELIAPWRRSRRCVRAVRGKPDALLMTYGLLCFV